MSYRLRLASPHRPFKPVPFAVAIRIERHLAEVAQRALDEREARELGELRFEVEGFAVTYTVDRASRSVVVLELERIAELAG